jgi:hypothetical protein
MGGCKFAECHHAPAHKTVARRRGKCVSEVDPPAHGVTRSQNAKASGNTNTAAAANAKGAITGTQVVGASGGGDGADGGSSPREMLEQVGMEEEAVALPQALAAETKCLHLMYQVQHRARSTESRSALPNISPWGRLGCGDQGRISRKRKHLSLAHQAFDLDGSSLILAGMRRSK